MPGHFAQVLHHLVHRPRLLVAAFVHQGVEHVGDGDDACVQVDALALQALRIAAAVILLVVLVGDDGGRLQDGALRAVQDGQAHGRVLLHDFPLGRIQLARLEQHSVRRGDLADVVHRCGMAQHRGFFLVHAGRHGQQMAHFRHAAHVVARFVGARFDHVAQAQNQFGLGIGDLLRQQDVVEGDRHAGAEHFQQLGVDLRDFFHALQHQQGRLAAAVGEVADIGVPLHARDLVGLGLIQLRQHVRRQQAAVVVADLGQDFVVVLAADGGGAAQPQQHAVLQAQQGHYLLQQAVGEVLQVTLLENMRRGGDHPLQSFAVIQLGAARLFHLHDVAIGAQCREGGGKQLGAIEFGLLFVVVDVVVDDHAFFRRLARLAGAQHDAGELVVQILAHPARHFQAAVFLLHHHVEEHQRDIGLARQYFLGFGAAVGVDKTKRAAVEPEAAQGQLGDVMNIRFVIDQQDFPRR